MNSIPRRFIRIWLGKKEIPELFETWWLEFQKIHPNFEFLTITDDINIDMPYITQEIYKEVSTYSGCSDILRVCALYEFGGIYVDTDVMPIKSFEPLLLDNRPFIAKRSEVSFEAAVIGSPAKHPALWDLIKEFPEWYYSHPDRSASVQTGTGFISSIWFGRPDIRHLPQKTFYPYNGFRAPKREDKLKMFSDKNNFPPEMLAAHFSNHRWGGKPK